MRRSGVTKLLPEACEQATPDAVDMGTVAQGSGELEEPVGAHQVAVLLDTDTDADADMDQLAVQQEGAVDRLGTLVEAETRRDEAGMSYSYGPSAGRADRGASAPMVPERPMTGSPATRPSTLRMAPTRSKPLRPGISRSHTTTSIRP